MSRYPYTPRSTKGMLPGEFWPIPLPSGRFACGRVIAIPPRNMGWPIPTRAFLAGLLDWVGDASPTESVLRGRRCLEQMMAHIKAITRHGQQIVGFRDLGGDSIEPRMHAWEGKVYRGFEYIRTYEHDRDRGVGTLPGAGPDYLNARAAYLFEGVKRA